MLISVPSAPKKLLLDLSGVRVEFFCALAGRKMDGVLCEDVTPRAWQTIEDDLVEVL